MTEAAAIIRQSQGREDSISLTLQRQEVTELANDVADDYNLIDLGNHTGFSIHMKGADDDERIDNHPDIEQLLRDLRDGRYSHLVAWDDTRIARDQFYWEVRRAAIQGGADMEFIEDVDDHDDLTFRVQRAVESQMKWNEIEKSMEAWRHRDEKGAAHGKPPFGLKYDEDGLYLVPDRDNGDWKQALRVLQLRDDGASYREIASEVDDVGKDRARRVCNRREDYEDVRDRTAPAAE